MLSYSIPNAKPFKPAELAYSISDAISAGLNVKPLTQLESFTECDPLLSFHQIPLTYGYIAQTLKWQSTNIQSEDFLSNEPCYFEDSIANIYFYIESNYTKSSNGRFTYALCELFEERSTLNFMLVLRGPGRIEASDLIKQFETRGFILWPTYSPDDILKNNGSKHGTFRKFYPNSNVTYFRDDGLLRCEYNTKKGISYLKLLHSSYVDRLAKTFDALPNVLLDIICSYVLGEFQIESLYW
ncbi:MAG: hypothetical protein Hyperionvirus39_5 [Hyperionvirus sp.]|uniref:Uncharacterized protein n=1 Tax=Hyperionvirus sp. TaxID=2487770 RepID=A0A3G5AC29_9VIRU|nr:MAG: hypothetical protein Hyperionvirus39_5 [Hyperionvirus sp.]